MSLNNALLRRCTPQSRKWHEHRRRGKKSCTWRKSRLRKWTQFKRKTSRRERHTARRELRLVERLLEEAGEMLAYRQHKPKRKHKLLSLRPQRVTDKIRTFRHKRQQRRKAEAFALTWLNT